MFDIEQLQSAWLGHRPFANWLVQHIHPRITVELGVDYGYSLFSLCERNRGVVYGIDSFVGDVHSGHHTDAENIVNNVISQNNYTNIRIIKGFFDDVALTWNKKIDILHIDGLHTYESTRSNWLIWRQFLSERGVVLFHDTISYPNDVGRLFNEINLPKYNFQHSAGLGVISYDYILIEDL